MSSGDGEKGFSAARAGKINQRCKKVRQIAEPEQYTVVDAAGTKHKGTFKIVAALCPGVIASTLKRRLDSGERKVEMLKRPPESKRGGRRKRK
jgi:hypothetical protein